MDTQHEFEYRFLCLLGNMCDLDNFVPAHNSLLSGNHLHNADFVSCAIQQDNFSWNNPLIWRNTFPCGKNPRGIHQCISSFANHGHNHNPNNWDGTLEALGLVVVVVVVQVLEVLVPNNNSGNKMGKCKWRKKLQTSLERRHTGHSQLPMLNIQDRKSVV